MGELEGRVALVTGAGRGIGAAIAERLAREGCSVAVNSLHDASARGMVDRLVESGAEAHAFPADVGDPRQVDAMVDTVEAWRGPVEILVNNAATLTMERLLDLDLKTWHDIVRVNLGGTFSCSRRVVPAMREAGWGRIVSISSIWGLIGAGGATPYCASKGGQVGLTRALAAELEGTGVRAHAVGPGVIDTDQLEADAAFAGIPLEEMKRRYAEGTLVGRIGTPEEIAGIVAFLASDAGAAFNGQVVMVTGGRAE